MKHVFIICVLLLAGGCTSVRVTPLDADTTGNVACIAENPSVKVPRFLDIVVNGFEEHGYITRVYRGPAHNSCDLLVTYTALRSWDFTPYMTDAEIWIRNREGKRVGYGQYHLKGRGGLALNKWASPESKMQKVFAELFPQ